MKQVTRRAMEKWLLDHGFTLLPGKASGHRHYALGSTKITLPGHGPQDLTKKHVGLIIRALERGGFAKDEVRRELEG